MKAATCIRQPAPSECLCMEGFTTDLFCWKIAQSKTIGQYGGWTMKYVTFIWLLSPLLYSPATESAAIKSLPRSQDIFTIAINPIPALPTPAQPGLDTNELLNMRYFTPESLREALPSFRPGEAEIKAGGRRIWESGVIVLNNKQVLFWTTCRKNFIQVLTPSGYSSFIIGDGKDDV